MTTAARTQRTIGELHRITEARLGGNGTTLNLTVIKAGFNIGRARFYAAEALRAGASMFSGVKMYANHQTRTEEHERPEGDLHQWVASLTEVAYDPATQSLRGVAKIIDPAFRDKAALLAEAGLLRSLGVSIRAVGAGENATVEGVPTFRVDEFLTILSVDFVTEAGAGGFVELLESASQRTGGGVDAQLREAFGRVPGMTPEAVEWAVTQGRTQPARTLEESFARIPGLGTEGARVAARGA